MINLCYINKNVNVNITKIKAFVLLLCGSVTAFE